MSDQIKVFPDDYLFWYQMSSELHEHLFAIVCSFRTFNKRDKVRGALEYLYTHDSGNDPHESYYYRKEWIRSNFSESQVDGKIRASKHKEPADRIEATFQHALNKAIHELNNVKPWTPFYTIKCLHSGNCDNLKQGHFLLTLQITDTSNPHIDLFETVFLRQIAEVSTYTDRSVVAVRFHRNTINAFLEKMKVPEIRERVVAQYNRDRLRGKDFLAEAMQTQSVLKDASGNKISITVPRRKYPGQFLNNIEYAKMVLHHMMNHNASRSELCDLIAENERLIFPLAEGDDNTKRTFVNVELDNDSIDFTVKGLWKTASVDLWTFYSIDHPSSPLFEDDGAPSKELANALSRIESWKEWLRDNPFDAMKKLPGCDQIYYCVVLIGRRTLVSPEQGKRLEELVESLPGISIHTFDYLLDY